MYREVVKQAQSSFIYQPLMCNAYVFCPFPVVASLCACVVFTHIYIPFIFDSFIVMPLFFGYKMSFPKCHVLKVWYYIGSLRWGLDGRSRSLGASSSGIYLLQLYFTACFSLPWDKGALPLLFPLLAQFSWSTLVIAVRKIEDIYAHFSKYFSMFLPPKKWMKIKLTSYSDLLHSTNNVIYSKTKF